MGLWPSSDGFIVQFESLTVRAGELRVQGTPTGQSKAFTIGGGLFPSDASDVRNSGVLHQAFPLKVSHEGTVRYWPSLQYLKAPVGLQGLCPGWCTLGAVGLGPQLLCKTPKRKL